MIKIRELMSTNVFEKMTLLGNHIWYDNEIDSIGIFEYEAIENQYNLFRKGDFVITTLMFAKNEAGMAENALIRLMKQRVSAIAIKNIYFDKVSEKVQNYADQHKIQLMMFDDIPFEDIIVAVSDEIRNKENIKFYETRIDLLLDQSPKKDHVVAIINEINSSFMNHSHCAFALPHTKDSVKQKRLIDQVMSRVRSRKNKGANSIHNNIFKYKNGIFVIHTFDVNQYENGYIKALLNKIGLNHDFKIGLSTIHHGLHEITYAIKEAITSISHDGDLVSFNDLGIDCLLMPLKDTYWAENYVRKMIQPILEHDQNASHKLLETALTYISHNGELKATAIDLGQHVNTIRHRLKRIKALVGYEDDHKDFYEQLFIAVRLYNFD